MNDNTLPHEATKHAEDPQAFYSLQKLEVIYQAVFRRSTEQPGFYFEDLGPQGDSSAFRKRMVALKEGLARLCKMHTRQRLNYQWMGRFSHQHTSQFHRDSAQPHSYLILGYEPTQVESKVSLADYTKLVEDQGISLAEYFGGSQEVNTANADPQLQRYVTELAPFPKNHYRLLLLNNSKSFETTTYGVFHRGEVLQKVAGEDRILNSLMLYTTTLEEEDPHTPQEVNNFVTTEHVDR
ncbi:MAG: hypothetical protein AAFQ98_10210 [Bacteroidota bacterium]